MAKRLSVLIFGLLLMNFLGCNTPERESTTEEAKPVQMSTEQRLEQVKSHLKTAKAELAQAGEYNCCVQPTCDWCALHEGECACYDNLKAGKEVCPGCGLGWHNGEGVVEGTTAKQVKWNITHEHGEEEHHH